MVGASAVPYGDKISVIHNFGRVTSRFIGGAVYSDKNKNGSYDPGEGFGSVQMVLQKAGKRTATWASGGYTIEINNGADVLLIEVAGVQNRVPVPKGGENVWFSWAVPPEQARRAADALIAKVNELEDNKRNAQKRRVALVNLYLDGQTLHLDEERKNHRRFDSRYSCRIDFCSRGLFDGNS